jgi:probable DNA metabolism protein
VNRRSNDIPRTAFTVQELVDLTMQFYRRNYIEGLFLSSGVIKSPGYTMERLTQVVRNLREEHCFNGYIHLKCIPGASRPLIEEAGRYVDRMSVNIELASEESLQQFAADKSYSAILEPMRLIHEAILENRNDRKRLRSTHTFVPAGQSTQVIVGAGPESDYDILKLSRSLYETRQLKRVYYSAYVPVKPGHPLLPVDIQPPLIRENRLYQADWLMRFYGFRLHELIQEENPHLAQDMDPKLSYAQRNPHLFPIDINHADRELILRIPGVGIRSTEKIMEARRFGCIRYEDLRKIGVVLKRAGPFILCPGMPSADHYLGFESNSCQKGEENRTETLVSGKPQITFVYDGSFEGLLTSVFEAYAWKTTPDSVKSKRNFQQSLFEKIMVVATDRQKAERVWHRLGELLGPRERKDLYHAFLSEMEGVELLVHQYVRKAVEKGQGIEGWHQLDCVRRIHQLSRRVGLEAHRMKGFVRFEKILEDLYVALIAPCHNVLPLVRDHFKERYADQRWIICDARRDCGIYYDLDEVRELYVPVSQLDTAVRNVVNGDDYRHFWIQYFASLSICERSNPKLHRRNLPTRYWKYLPEKAQVHGRRSAISNEE